jgi:hypothetical protein
MNSPYTPDWSRVHCIQEDNINPFPFFCMYIVGHSAEKNIRIKHLKHSDPDKNIDYIKAFVDMRLSRAFGEEPRPRYILCLDLHADHIEYQKLHFSLTKL